MKKFNITGLMFLLLAIFTGCKEDTFTLTSELPQFETREGLMLLEVIVPYGTGVNDQIYIYGDFNGGMEAVGQPQWLLQRANTVPGVPSKFGIYIDPATMQDGKTLADGYSFYNIQNGPEMDVNKELYFHYNYPKEGERLNVFVDYWEQSFNYVEDPSEVEHDGYAVYVINNTGWTELALYAWGDAEAFGGWPGITQTGRMDINGVTYTYFDTGADNEGLNLNLIFNNNGNGSQLPDVNVTLDRDYYFELTEEGAVELDQNASITHDGYAVYVFNNTGWDDVFLYMWGDVNDLNGGWPGMLPTGSLVINGVGYLYYDMGEANKDLAENLIFNNGNGTQLADFAFTINKDIYLEITTSGVTEIDPNTFNPGGNTPSDPSQPSEPVGEEYNIYILNNTGWDQFFVYSWGDGELFGGWPGQTSTDTADINGDTFMVFTVTGTGGEANLIFNDNNGTQYDAMTITVDKDYYIIAGPESAELYGDPTYHLYIENQTGWNSFFVYAWGDEETFGGWPGTSSTATATINGIEYLVFDFIGNGNTENLIFNDNNGTQYDAFTISLDKDYYITATASAATIKE